MTVTELKKAAESLTREECVSLAEFLLDELSEPDYDVSDEEVMERKRELDSGEVADISFDELKERLHFLRQK